MIQSRVSSLLEAATRSIVVMPIGFAVTSLVGLFGLPWLEQAAVMTATMFVCSTSCGYIIRRSFDNSMTKEAFIAKWREEARLDRLHDAATYDHMEPLSSHNWEPPKFERILSKDTYSELKEQGWEPKKHER